MNKKMLVAVCVVIIAVAGIAGYFALRGAREELPDLTGKKILMVIAPGNFNDTELETPVRVLGDAGANISIASTTTNTVTGMYRKEVKLDMKLEQVEVQSYDAVIFVGGYGRSGLLPRCPCTLNSDRCFRAGKESMRDLHSSSYSCECRYPIQ